MLTFGLIVSWLDPPMVSIYQGLGMPHVPGSIPNQCQFQFKPLSGPLQSGKCTKTVGFYKNPARFGQNFRFQTLGSTDEYCKN